MITFSKKQNIILNSIASVVFAGLFILNVILAYIDFKGMFMGDGMLISEFVVMPIRTILFSSLFFIVLCAYSVAGYILKNKCLIGISLGYSILLFMGFVLFAIFALNVLEIELLNTIAMWYSIISMAPMFGFVWYLGIFAVALFLVHFVALIVFSIKVFKVKK